MTDALNQGTPGGGGEFIETCVTRVAFGAAELDLDEFVVVQRALRLGDHARRDTLLTDQQHGIERVAQPS